MRLASDGYRCVNFTLMVAVQAGSVHRENVFMVLRAFGFRVVESPDSVEISRESDPPFLEVWPIPEDQTFIFKRHVMRLARLSGIPPHLFWNPDQLARFLAKNA